MDVDIHNYRYRLAREEDLLRRSGINKRNRGLILKFKKGSGNKHSENSQIHADSEEYFSNS